MSTASSASPGPLRLADPKNWTGLVFYPGLRFLKLRVSALRKIKAAKTQGTIITRRVSEGFPETLRKTQKQNPSLTQRVGIAPNSQVQKTAIQATIPRLNAITCLFHRRSEQQSAVFVGFLFPGLAARSSRICSRVLLQC